MNAPLLLMAATVLSLALGLGVGLRTADLQHDEVALVSTP